MGIINFDMRIVHDKTHAEITKEINSLFDPQLYDSPGTLNNKNDYIHLTYICVVVAYRDMKRPLPEHECIMIIVMTHGDCGGILYDCNLEQYFVREVWRPFVEKVSSDIPLIFVFQVLF